MFENLGERIKKPLAITGLVATSFGFVACGPRFQQPTDGKIDSQTTDDSFSVTHDYTPEGMRITEYRNRGKYLAVDQTYAYCDGPDMVEFPAGGGNKKTGTTVITRSAGHTACEDGKLKPEDFLIAN